MKYRLVSGGSHTRFEDGVAVRYKRGDLIELTGIEARALDSRVEIVDAAKSISPPKPAKRRAKKRTAKR